MKNNICTFRDHITFTHILCSLIIVFASSRGFFIYHLGLPSSVIYNFSAAMLIVAGVLSLAKMLTSRLGVGLVLLKNVVILNTVWFLFFISGGFLISVVAGTSASNLFSWLYYFLVFPIIFYLLRFDERLLVGIVFIVAGITAIGVYYFFNLGISGGFDAIYDAHSILRPGAFAYSRTPSYLLPFGYAGSSHDTANILVICGAFFLTRFFLSSKMHLGLFYLTCYFLSVSMTMLTGSAANFLVLLLISSVSFFCYIKRRLVALLIFFIILGGAFFSLSALASAVDLTGLLELAYVFDKLDPDRMDEDLWASLDLTSVRQSAVSTLLGFGGYTESPLVLSEVAYVSLLSRLGILPFCLLMFVGFSPVYYLFVLRLNRRRYEQLLTRKVLDEQGRQLLARSRDDSFRVLMMAMPVFAGFLTLIHYGSLFRITSIGLFCVVLALFLAEYLRVTQRMLRSLA